MPFHVGEAEAPADSAGPAQRRRQPYRQPCQQGKQHEGRSKTADDGKAKPPLTRLPEHHPGQRGKTNGIGGQQTNGWHEAVGKLAAQHAQRGNTFQLHERRQRKPQEQYQSDQHPLSGGQPARQWQGGRQQVRQPQVQDKMRQIAQRTACQHGNQAQQEELPEEDA